MSRYFLILFYTKLSTHRRIPPFCNLVLQFITIFNLARLIPFDKRILSQYCMFVNTILKTF